MLPIVNALPAAPPAADESPDLKAPWASGVHLRAGGLTINFGSVSGIGGLHHLVLQLGSAGPLVLGLVRLRLPGLHYNRETLTGRNRYAIDFTKGIPIRPAGGIGGRGPQRPLPAPRSTGVEPGLCSGAAAARQGLVLRSIFHFAEGNPEDANRIEIGIWQNLPRSVAEVSAPRPPATRRSRAS